MVNGNNIIVITKVIQQKKRPKEIAEDHQEQ